MDTTKVSASDNAVADADLRRRPVPRTGAFDFDTEKITEGDQCRTYPDVTSDRNFKAFRRNALLRSPLKEVEEPETELKATSDTLSVNDPGPQIEFRENFAYKRPFAKPLRTPRELLLGRNPFEDSSDEDFDDSLDTSPTSSLENPFDDPVVAHAIREKDKAKQIEISRIESPTKYIAYDYPDIEEPLDPARILKKSDLRKQRTVFFSVVVGLNLAALFTAVFVGTGTWVFVFILFIKSKDCLSVVISAVGLSCSALWRLIRPPPPVPCKWILSLIPAYSESEEQIVKTIFSLRDNNVEPHKQVMCVILDGKHREVKSHMTRIVKSFQRPYVTSKFKLGELIIDAGFMENVPVICFEKVKNSGKKDSLILCHDLFNVMRENAPLYTKLLRDEIWTQVLPPLTEAENFNTFDMVFCTDADSTIYKGAVAGLANAVARDKNAIAACGLVLVELEPSYEWSRWNLYQQFQYTFGQYVRRRAEGFIGKVTCLPGCITMIAVRPEMAGAIRKYAEPITAYPVILHQVQYLGTDRRLTYSMLSQNKKLHTLFVPNAVSETVAPQSLQHYLSQRRRWGSNAYFNNFFYCFGEKMILITRIEALIEVVRLTMVYYRIANTLMFIYGLTQKFDPMKIIPLLIVSQLPTLWFAFSVIFLERELRRRGFKLFLGFCLNKVLSPFISITVFTKVAKNLGSQVWGMTGGANATAATSIPTGPSQTSLATSFATTVDELPGVAVMGTLVEGAVGEQLSNLSEKELAEEEHNEKLAGAEENISPF